MIRSHFTSAPAAWGNSSASPASMPSSLTAYQPFRGKISQCDDFSVFVICHHFNETITVRRKFTIHSRQAQHGWNSRSWIIGEEPLPSRQLPCSCKFSSSITPHWGCTTMPKYGRMWRRSRRILKKHFPDRYRLLAFYFFEQLLPPVGDFVFHHQVQQAPQFTAYGRTFRNALRHQIPSIYRQIP